MPGLHACVPELSLEGGLQLFGRRWSVGLLEADLQGLVKVLKYFLVKHIIKVDGALKRILSS